MRWHRMCTRYAYGPASRNRAIGPGLCLSPTRSCTLRVSTTGLGSRRCHIL